MTGASVMPVRVTAGVTVTLALPSFPAKLAVMAAVPPDKPLATPVADTEATAALAEAQLTELLMLRLLPSAKLPVATRLCAPLIAMLGEAGVTAMEFKVATGKTLIVTETDLAPDIATTGVVPGETAVTSPLAFTVAIVLAPELHVMVFVILAVLPSE